MTALMIAARGGMLQILEVLYRHGASIDKQDNSGNTSLHYAYAYRKNDAANSLEAMGADSKTSKAKSVLLHNAFNSK